MARYARVDDYHRVLERRPREFVDGLSEQAGEGPDIRRRWPHERPGRGGVDSDDAVVRLHAAWALGRIGGRLAVEALQAALERGHEPDARAEIEMSLEGLAVPARSV